MMTQTSEMESLQQKSIKKDIDFYVCGFKMAINDFSNVSWKNLKV
jgi:hypothetical protein